MKKEKHGSTGDEEIKKTQTFPEQSQNDDDEEEDADISSEEIAILNAAEGEIPAAGISLDTTDDDGEPLNEKSLGDDVTGEDLDVPGSEDDDDNEAIGEEDEENNSYSLGTDKEEGDLEERDII